MAELILFIPGLLLLLPPRVGGGPAPALVPVRDASSYKGASGVVAVGWWRSSCSASSSATEGRWGSELLLLRLPCPSQLLSEGGGGGRSTAGAGCACGIDCKGCAAGAGWASGMSRPVEGRRMRMDPVRVLVMGAAVGAGT